MTNFHEATNVEVIETTRVGARWLPRRREMTLASASVLCDVTITFLANELTRRGIHIRRVSMDYRILVISL